MLLLEEFEAGTRYHGHIAKVDIVHLNVSGADDLMNYRPVEPHSFGGYAADLALSDKSLRETVAF